MLSFLTILPMNNQVIRTDKAPAISVRYIKRSPLLVLFSLLRDKFPWIPVTGEIVSGEISAKPNKSWPI
jgi:2-iminobutanoate/2-iminopropanoate deaminase